MELKDPVQTQRSTRTPQRNRLRCKVNLRLSVCEATERTAQEMSRMKSALIHEKSQWMVYTRYKGDRMDSPLPLVAVTHKLSLIPLFVSVLATSPGSRGQDVSDDRGPAESGKENPQNSQTTQQDKKEKDITCQHKKNIKSDHGRKFN